MAMVGEILDVIVDGMFKRVGLSATPSLLLGLMTLTVVILLLPTAG